MQKTYFIYKLTSPSGRVYIGQTVNINRRFNCYKNLKCKGQPKLHSSLIKYGWNNFKKEILFNGEVSQKEINDIETKYILKYINKTLNISLKGNGGNGRFGKTHFASKPVLQIDLDFNIINEFSCGMEVKEKLKYSQSCISKACRTDNPKIYNYYWRFKESYNKDFLIKLVNNKVRPDAIPIYQLDVKKNTIIKQWTSQIEASKALKINQANIWRVLNDMGKSAGGYGWVYKHKYQENYKPIFKSKKVGKSILVKSLDGKILHRFESIKNTADFFKIDKSSIIRQLKNKVLNPKKYIYEYDNPNSK